MNPEQEIEMLQAESMVCQMLIVGLCKSIIGIDRKNLQVIEQAFTYADDISTISAMKLTGEGQAKRLSSMSKMIEQLRAAVLESDGNPKGLV